MAKKTRFEDEEVNFSLEEQIEVAAPNYDGKSYTINKKDGVWQVFVINYDKTTLQVENNMVSLGTSMDKLEALEHFKVIVAREFIR